MNRGSFQKMTVDKKSRAGLTLPGGHQIKEAGALVHIVYFFGIGRIPHLPHRRSGACKAARGGPPRQKKDRPRQLVPFSKKFWQ